MEDAHLALSVSGRSTRKLDHMVVSKIFDFRTKVSGLLTKGFCQICTRPNIQLFWDYFEYIAQVKNAEFVGIHQLRFSASVD